MDQQFRKLPGIFDPAREVFYAQRNIQDVVIPGADTSIATIIESRAQHRGASAPTPPNNGKYWPVLLNIPGTECKKVKESRSSINEDMQDRFFRWLWHDFLALNAEFRVPWDKLCILTPHRAITNYYIDEYLHERGLDLTSSTIDPWEDVGSTPDPGQGEDLAGAMGALVVADAVGQPDDVPEGPEPTVRMHNPMGLDSATIDSYQGQEKDLVFFFSTVSASSGPKFVANPNRLCVAFTRMRQAMIVVGDLGTRTKHKKTVTEDGQHQSTKALNELWGWFPKNERVVQWVESSD